LVRKANFLQNPQRNPMEGPLIAKLKPNPPIKLGLEAIVGPSRQGRLANALLPVTPLSTLPLACFWLVWRV
jgi:hypothetical protein